MKKTISYFVTVLLSFIILVSCDNDKDKNEVKAIENVCYLSQISISNDTIVYNYNEKNVLESIASLVRPNFRVDLEYHSDGKILAYRYFDGNIETEYDSISYTEEGLVSEINYYYINSKSSHPLRNVICGKYSINKGTELYSRISYEYSNGIISRYNYFNEANQLSSYIDVELDAKGNIITESYHSFYSEPSFFKRSTNEFKYDNKHHPLKPAGLVQSNASYINNQKEIIHKDFDENGNETHNYIVTLEYDYNENDYPLKSYMTTDSIVGEVNGTMEYICL